MAHGQGPATPSTCWKPEREAAQVSWSVCSCEAEKVEGEREGCCREKRLVG